MSSMHGNVEQELSMLQTDPELVKNGYPRLKMFLWKFKAGDGKRI